MLTKTLKSMRKRVNSIVLLIVCMVLGFNTKMFALEDVSKVVIDYDDWVDDISVTIRDQHYGPIVVSGQTKVFGASFVNQAGETKVCDFRYAAFKNGKIVQLYDGTGEVTLENKKMHDIKVPCYIDLPEGDYIFYPVVRFKGETKWNMLNWWGSIEKNGYWKLHVYENYAAPSSEYMCFPDDNGKGDSEYTVYHANQNEKFRVQMRLVNNKSVPMKGKIKLMWERDLAKFWRGMKYDANDVDTEWSLCATKLSHIGNSVADENGGIPISIEANGKLDIMFEDCHISEFFDYGDRWAPYMTAYFLSDGKEDIESNWLQIVDNTDSHFDADMNLKSDFKGWDDAINFLCFEIREGNVTGTEELVVSKVGMAFDKSSGMITLNNIPTSSFARVVDLNGRLVQTTSTAGSDSFSFVLKPGSGVNIISLITTTDGWSSHSRLSDRVSVRCLSYKYIFVTLYVKGGMSYYLLFLLLFF